MSSSARTSSCAKKSSSESEKNSVPPIEVSPSIEQRAEPIKTETAITVVAKPQVAEIISVASLDVAMVENRHNVDGDALSEYIERHFEGVFATLRHIRPLLEEMRRRFKTLPRGKRPDGTFHTIRGCRNFKEWVLTTLHRSERAVYYALEHGNPPKLETKAEKDGDGARRREARYTVTLTVEAARLKVVTRKAKKAFGRALKRVAKREVPSNEVARLAKAIEEIKNVECAIKTLRKDRLKAANGTSNAQETHRDACARGFETVIKHLRLAASVASNVSSELD